MGVEAHKAHSVRQRVTGPGTHHSVWFLPPENSLSQLGEKHVLHVLQKQKQPKQTMTGIQPWQGLGVLVFSMSTFLKKIIYFIWPCWVLVSALWLSS